MRVLDKLYGGPCVALSVQLKLLDTLGPTQYVGLGIVSRDVSDFGGITHSDENKANFKDASYCIDSQDHLGSGNVEKLKLRGHMVKKAFTGS